MTRSPQFAPALAIAFACLLVPPAARAGDAPAPSSAGRAEPLATRLTPCLLVASATATADTGRVPSPTPGAGEWPRPPRRLAKVVLLETAGAAVSSLGFLDSGGRVKAVVFGAGALLVARDYLEGRPLPPARGYAAAFLGLTALAVADLALERDGASRGTIVAVDFAALNAIALAARAGARD